MKRIAVIGAGIAGLGTAHALQHAPGQRQVTLFEAAASCGGHAHTVDVTLPDAKGRPVTHGVDTGFLVFNDRTYPQLIALLAQLGVQSTDSDMSFSVQIPSHTQPGSGLPPGLEWCGSSLDSVFAQRRNLLSGPFWRMLADLLRFNRLCTRLAQASGTPLWNLSIGQFLDEHKFSGAFRQGYLLPMIACIWSCPVDQMLAFPIGTLIRFCHNHGLLQITDRPQWKTVRGGSRTYVERLVSQLSDVRVNCPVLQVSRSVDAAEPAGSGGLRVHTPSGIEAFDEVVLATHADVSLRLLGQTASPALRSVLSGVRFQSNLAVLHTDDRLLPARPKAWAAWNYERAAHPDEEGRSVCLHYLINRLQPLPWAQPVLVTLNPLRRPDPASVLGEFEYDHPVFDLEAIQAQSRLQDIQGQHGLWIAGAWTGYGFHEDGLTSALGVASAMLARPPQDARVGAPLARVA